MITLSCEKQSFALASPFTIARGSRTHADVLYCKIDAFGASGVGEAMPYKRYNEDIDILRDTILQQHIWLCHVDDTLEDPLTIIRYKRALLQEKCPAGAARNALDCALWDLEITISKQQTHYYLGLDDVKKLHSWISLSIDTPENMANKAYEYFILSRDKNLPLRLKIKLGAGDGLDKERLQKIYNKVGNGHFIIDANEGWSIDETADMMPFLTECHCALLEQPIAAADSALLSNITPLVPICADEAFHTIDDLAKYQHLYQAINIKLDKTGGLTQAMMILEHARQFNYKIMVGCMMATSLAMAPAYFIAQQADFIDLDAPIWIAEDRIGHLMPDAPYLQRPDSQLWGL